MRVIVHERVLKRHPDLSAEDVMCAWRNAFAMQERSGGGLYGTVLVGIGADNRGRLLELVAQVRDDGIAEVFHSMTPPSRKLMAELGMEVR